MKMTSTDFDLSRGNNLDGGIDSQASPPARNEQNNQLPSPNCDTATGDGRPNGQAGGREGQEEVGDDSGVELGTLRPASAFARAAAKGRGKRREKRRRARQDRLGIAAAVSNIPADLPSAMTNTQVDALTPTTSTRPGAYPSDSFYGGYENNSLEDGNIQTPAGRDEQPNEAGLLVADAVLADPPPPLVEASELTSCWSVRLILGIVLLLTVVMAMSISIPLTVLSGNSDKNEDSSTTPIPDKVWTQQGIDIDGEVAGDWSGWSVSLSSDGSVIAIGAVENNDNGNDSGHVRVYEYTSNGTWTQRGSDIEGEAADDFSGHSVSLSSDGSVIAIGAINNDDNGDDSGHVRVYEYTSSGALTQRGSDIDGEAAGDWSGGSVSLSSDGSVIAIGARYNDGNGRDSGHVRVYEYNGSSAWTQRGIDIDGEAAGDNSGISMSLSSDGSVIAIGSIYNDGNGDDSGHVRVYEYTSNGTWIRRGNDIDGETAGDNSGWSISLSSDGIVIAISSYRNDDNGSLSGHVSVYEYTSNGTWTQRGSDIEGEAADDRSGGSVSLSSDGSVIAIGAIWNDDNGDDSGHVRVYEYNGSSAWTQRGIDIDGEAAGDRSGYSVSLSSDGSVLATGTIWNDGNGDDSGHVRVYKFE